MCGKMKLIKSYSSFCIWDSL